MRELAVSVPCWKKNYVILRKQAHLNKCLPKEACPFSYTHTWHLSLSSLSTYFWMPDRPKWSKKGKKLREIDVKSLIFFLHHNDTFLCPRAQKMNNCEAEKKILRFLRQISRKILVLCAKYTELKAPFCIAWLSLVPKASREKHRDGWPKELKERR